jgi:CMP-N-acetylneuraminic acid synthetase
VESVENAAGSPAIPDPACVLALIPARAGSKSIPRKNLRPIAGKPLLAHTINHALGASRIGRVIVTTDSEEIASVARSYGAEAPFLRPTDISGDFSLDVEFHRHALEWLRKEESYVPSFVVHLRPTHPVRRCDTIDRAIALFAATPEADALRSVTLSDISPFKMWTIDNNGYLFQVASASDLREPYNQPRQLLPLAYRQDGYIDITRPSVVMEKNSTTGDRILPFVIDEVCIDIDYEDEIAEAERLLSGANTHGIRQARPRSPRHPS